MQEMVIFGSNLGANQQPYIGASGRVSEVLNRKRDLTLVMIKKLHKGLNIPYDCLIH
jgi:HTH-type transcriptional regulator/antitoxin HigA